jgi:hypothetical protein
LVTWLHNSHIIDEKLNKYKRIGVDNSSLLIKNIQASDSGLYSCEAKTTEDLTHASANVVVQSIPQIIKGPRSIRMQETMDVEVRNFIFRQYYLSKYQNSVLFIIYRVF